MKVKIGDKVRCIDDDSEDLDLGASGIVLYGRRDLKIGGIYKIISINKDGIPKNKDRFSERKLWSNEDYENLVKPHNTYIDVESETKKFSIRCRLDLFELT